MVLSTKFKIILIVFAVIAGLYVLQFIINSVTKSSKREAFENDDFDDEPNEKPRSNKKKEEYKDSDDEDDNYRKKKNKKGDDAEGKKTKKGDDDEGKKKAKKGIDDSDDGDKKDRKRDSGKDIRDSNIKKERKDKYEDEDDSKKEKRKPVDDKTIKLEVLEKIEDVFAKAYPDSDKKPIVFDMLTRNEHFVELKDKYEDKQVFENHIQKIVKNTMNDIESVKIDEPKKETFQDLMDKPFNRIMEHLDNTESKAKLMSDLDDVVNKIEKIQVQLKKIPDEEKDKDQKQSGKGSKGYKKQDVIEGFENRYNYASY